jgi:hypothetical protein
LKGRKVRKMRSEMVRLGSRISMGFGRYLDLEDGDVDEQCKAAWNVTCWHYIGRYC